MMFKKLVALVVPILLCSGCQEHDLKREAVDWMEATDPGSHNHWTRFGDLRVKAREKRVCGRAFYRGDGFMGDPAEREWLFIYQRGRMPIAIHASESVRPEKARLLKRWRDCAADD